ncbi:MAG TPA: hypothetical protein VF705_02740 [Longimicrobium sp.]|jgi:hypothetical protein
MSRPHEHDALRALVAAGRPEALAPEQIDRILHHADECPDCSAELRDFAAIAVLAQAPELRLDRDHSARLRARVLAQAAPVRARPAPRRSLALTRSSGWLAAAAMAVALITHHGFHEPLRAGWLAAGAFALLALGLALYADHQRRRLADLEQQLGSHRDTEAQR